MTNSVLYETFDDHRSFFLFNIFYELTVFVKTHVLPFPPPIIECIYRSTSDNNIQIIKLENQWKVFEIRRKTLFFGFPILVFEIKRIMFVIQKFILDIPRIKLEIPRSIFEIQRIKLVIQRITLEIGRLIVEIQRIIF